jgi:hypothetical protein
LILTDVEVELRGEEVIDIIEVQLGISSSEVHIGVSLTEHSAVSKVDVVPTSEVLLVGDGLPEVSVSSTLEVIVVVGCECKDISGLRSSNPETKGTISEALGVSVVFLVVDRESKSGVPDSLGLRLSPFEPTAD